jgi:hypothetical protein
MGHQNIVKPASGLYQRRQVHLRALRNAMRDWMTSDGLVWLHLFKTVTAALLAMGIAMLLDLQQPRTAMTTVFVLMQPVSGMVLAKSFYRVCGTAAGTIAALVLAAIFVQQPELHLCWHWAHSWRCGLACLDTVSVSRCFSACWPVPITSRCTGLIC